MNNIRKLSLFQGDDSHFRHLVRGVSKYLLENQRPNSSVTITEVSSSGPVLGHWMAIILVTGPAFKLTFKTQFMGSMAQDLAKEVYKKKAAEVLEGQALDYMKEFANLCAGFYKRIFLNLGKNSGVSLPVVTRGFDEIFSNTDKGTNEVQDLWSLKTSNGQIYCSVHLEAFQPIHLNEITLSLEDLINSGTGEVEFL